ncbi:hypothetical protein MMC16_006578 [Acarospora aff. strigata]|nr:hypothetical protein [Acarospora aff. strigata]
MSPETVPIPVTLFEVLSIDLVLHQTVPYLPISALLSLAGTSKSFQTLLYNTPGIFRYLNLSTVQGAAIPFAPIDPGGEVWRSQRMDEAVTEDDFYAGPLRGIFSNLRRKNILQDVQTLVLDGLSVSADLIWEIIRDAQYNVRLLSIREVKNLNEKKLMQILRYCVRPSRAKDTPKLKGLYVFGPKDSTAGLKAGRQSLTTGHAPNGNMGVMSSEGAQLGMEWNHKSHDALSSALAADGDRWYQPWGKIITGVGGEWAETVQACEGIIAFDAVLCRGPRHHMRSPGADTDDSSGDEVSLMELLCTHSLPPSIATIALGPGGCTNCHTSPEGPAIFGAAPQAALPLLAPPPLHSSTLSAAQRPITEIGKPPPKLFVRCAACQSDRCCEHCNKWWCETCYPNNQLDPYSTMERIDKPLDLIAAGYIDGTKSEDMIKVHLGLCIEGCLVSEMMAGAGEGGMWG